MTNAYKGPLRACVLSYSLDVSTNSFGLTHLGPVSCIR